MQPSGRLCARHQDLAQDSRLIKPWLFKAVNTLIMKLVPSQVDLARSKKNEEDRKRQKL